MFLKVVVLTALGVVIALGTARYLASQQTSAPAHATLQKNDDSDEISLVRDGFLKVQFRNGAVRTYDGTTLGKALETTFPKGQWKYFRTKKDIGVVEFSATRSDIDLERDGINTSQAECVESTEIEVADPRYSFKVVHCQVSIRFQFEVSADRKSFSLAYISLTDPVLIHPGGSTPTDAQVLTYIYN